MESFVSSTGMKQPADCLEDMERRKSRSHPFSLSQHPCIRFLNLLHELNLEKLDILTFDFHLGILL